MRKTHIIRISPNWFSYGNKTLCGINFILNLHAIGIEYIKSYRNKKCLCKTCKMVYNAQQTNPNKILK